MSGSSHTLGTSAWGPTWILTWPQSWVEREIEMETSQTADTAHDRSPVPPTAPSLSWADAPALRALHCIFTMKQGLPQPWKKLSWLWDAKGSSNPTCCLSKVGSSHFRWWHSRVSQEGHLSPRLIPTVHLLLQHCSPLAWSWVLGGTRAHTESYLSQPGPDPRGFCSSSMRPDPTPAGNWEEGKPSPSHLTPAPPPTTPPPTKWQLPARSSEERCDLCSCPIQLSHQRTHRLHGILPLKDSFTDARGNCFTWLHRDREK